MKKIKSAESKKSPCRTLSESKTRSARTFILKSSGLVQHSGTDFIEPVAGPIESPKRSLSESVSGPVESVLKVQAADPF